MSCWLLMHLATALAVAARATQLPSFRASPGGGWCARFRRPSVQCRVQRTAELERSGKWWAHIGDHVYHAPPAASGLSELVGDYYYAFGSEQALTDELRDRKVGGQGRLHIFHLPEGPSMLQLERRTGNRRSSLSDLSQLKEGMQISHQFPPYTTDLQYNSPLNVAAQDLEKTAVERIKATTIMSYLESLTSFATRSYMNSAASDKVQKFLVEQFHNLNYTTCMHPFSSGGPATNIVAIERGTSNSSDAVVIGAHYDDIPAFGKAPGAEDNGSGVAALLTIMRALREAHVRPEKSVLFVAFAGEEPGLLGSDAFSQALLQPRSSIPESCLPPMPVNVDASSSTGFMRRMGFHVDKRSPRSFKAIIMDEVGWRSPQLADATVNLESYDWTHEVMENLAQANRDHNGNALKVVHSSYPFGSDHMSFLKRDIPGVLTINGDDEAYPFYHTSQDQISSVDGDLVAMIAKMNMGGLLRMAGIAA